MKKTETTQKKKEEYDSDDYESDNYDEKDSFIQDEDDDDISEGSSYKEPQKKKKIKKESRLVGLTKEERGELNKGKSGKKKKRLMKLKEQKQIRKPSNDDDDFLDDEDDELDKSMTLKSYDDLDIQTKKKKNKYNHDILDDVFNAAMFEDNEQQNEVNLEEEENKDENIQKHIYSSLNPEEQKKLFVTEKDQEIKYRDVPERLQIKFENRTDYSEENLVHEAKWITNKLMIKKNLPDNYSTKLQVKVYSVLENLIIKKHEIMYIWMYLRHEITSNRKGNLHFNQNEELSIDDLWTIYYLDDEWQVCAQLKIACTKLLKILDKTFQIPQNTRTVLESSLNKEHLIVAYEYLKFKLKAFMEEEEIEMMFNENQNSQGLKKFRKRNQTKELYDKGMNLLIDQISISAEQLADNFEKNIQDHSPPLLRQGPSSWSEDVCKTNVSYLKDPTSTLQALCKLIAAEYFHHPIIRTYLKNFCIDKIYLKTTPTKKGKETLDVYHQFYPTKRITGKKILQLKPEFWMLILDSEQKGFINIEFVMGHERDRKWNDLKRKIEKLIYYNREIKGSSEKKIIDKWNKIRSKICENVVKIYAKPTFEKEIREYLTEKGKNTVVENIKSELKALLNNKPYKPKLNISGNEFDPERDNQQRYNNQQRFDKNDPSLHSPKVLAVTLTSNINTHSKDIEAVLVSLDEFGKIDGVLRLKNCFRKMMNNRSSSLQIQFERSMDKLKDFINEKKPKVIVLSPKSLMMQGLKIQLHDLSSELFSESSSDDKPFVMWGDSRISEIFSKSEMSKEVIENHDPTIREAVSLGRYVQDPLSETLNLWSFRYSENLLLKLVFDPMQHLLPKKEIHNHLETVILEMVGIVGVNINRCYKQKHRASPLQFVSGLGPRKSKYLIENLNKFFKDKFIGGRSDLNDCGFLSDKIYELCIGFLRFYKEDIEINNILLEANINPLDLTRIHPQNEDRATKIVLEALQLEVDRNKKKKDYSAEYIKIMQNVDLVKELDLISYGEHLSKKKQCNVHWQIQFIERELEKPFEDPREDFRTNIKNQELFYKLTNENKNVLYESSIILMQVKSNDYKGLKLVTNNGVQSFIMSEELMNQLEESKMNESEIINKFPVNTFTYVRVRKIDYEKQKLNVTLNEFALNAHHDFLRNSKILERWGLDDSSFKVYKDEDYPKIISQKKLKQAVNFIPRSIRHPYFKNIPWMNAEDYLKNRPQGDFIIRPSGQGNNYLNVTWKIFPKFNFHMIVREGHKSEKEEISQQLFLNKEKEVYTSLDDIIESYIKPVNALIQKSMLHSKFILDPIEKVKEKVKSSKKEDPTKIPYFFSPAQLYPNNFVLTYILNRMKVVHELVFIKPDGLIFHDQKFFTIEDLIMFFKKNLKSSEYSNYLQNAPSISFSKKHKDENENKSRYKQEDRYGVKMEDRSHLKKRSNYKRDDSSESYKEKYRRRENNHVNRNYSNQPKYRGDYYNRSAVKQEHRQDNYESKVKIEDTYYMNKRNFSNNNNNRNMQYNQNNNKGFSQQNQQQPVNAMYMQPPTMMTSNYSQNLMNMGFNPDPNFTNNQYVYNQQLAQNLNMLSHQMNPYGYIPPPPKKPENKEKKN